MKPIGRWLCATMASLAFTATALAQANDAPAESEPKVERSANPISGASETAPAASDASSPVDECLNAGSMAPADIFARCVLASDSEPDNIEVLRILARLALEDLGGFATALAYLQRLDALGDAEAPYEIGWAYYRGNGVEEDEARAAEYFRRAADRGNGLAMAWLGRMIELADGGLQRSQEEAVRLYRRALETGQESPAPLFLGYILIDGNPAEIEEGIRLLIGHDSSFAHAALTNHYLPGTDGKGNDLKKAVRHMRIAAEKGDSEMMYTLAFILEGGDPFGEFEDPDESARWLLLSIENGFEQGLDEMRDNVGKWSFAFRKALQRRLKEAGYYSGGIDGKFGAASMDALEDFALDSGL